MIISLRFENLMYVIIIFLSVFLQNFFLCQDCLSRDVPSHLAQPCYVALGRANVSDY